MFQNKILVYVQALPVSISDQARKFNDLRDSEFEMSHSSKMALSVACSFNVEVVAVGYSPILAEAIARGATSCRAVSLCDDPVQQFSHFSSEDADHMILGDSPEWVFTGASLAGVISESLDRRLVVCRDDELISRSDRSVILMIDSGKKSPAIDIRRINSALEVKIDQKPVSGSSTLLREESHSAEKIGGESMEIASSITRRLARICR